MLSVAQVIEIKPGDAQNASWINPGFIGLVVSIKTQNKTSGGQFFPCVIRDTEISATIEVSFFTHPGFSEGDTIEISGQGLRRTEYRGKAQAAIGKSTEVHLLKSGAGRSTQPQDEAPPADRAPAANPGLASTPAAGGGSPIFGATVGMAINQAVGIIKEATEGPLDLAYFTSPDFSRDLHVIASDIIRITRVLEAGHLAPNPKQRLDPDFAAKQEAAQKAAAEAEVKRKQEEERQAAARAQEAARKTAGKPQPGPGGSVAPGVDEDVPF